MKGSRKFNGYCEKCKKSLCPEHTYSYVDANIGAITQNAPYLCKACYEKTYNEKILSEVDCFKKSLIDMLEQINAFYHIETIRIDKLIEYIKNFKKEEKIS